MCLYTAKTRLLATNESAVEKKPRLRLTIVRSSSVKPWSFFQRAMSAVILISCGIQWFAQPSKYFCQAQSYLKGTSWLRSARQLIIFLSSTWIRLAPISIFSKPVAPWWRCSCSRSSSARSIISESFTLCDMALSSAISGWVKMAGEVALVFTSRASAIGSSQLCIFLFSSSCYLPIGRLHIRGPRSNKLLVHCCHCRCFARH